MGEYADMAREYEDMECEPYIPVYPNPIFDTWTDNSGGEHKISEMSDYYLNNCINMLKKNQSLLAPGYIKSMTVELSRRKKKMNLGRYSVPGVQPGVQQAPKSELHEQMQTTQGIESEQPLISNVDLKVAGVTFTNEDGTSRKEAIYEMADNISKGTTPAISLVREPENKFDINAIKVIAGDKQIGYIGKEYASVIAPLMDAGKTFTAKVKGCGQFNKRPYCELTINQL